MIFIPGCMFLSCHIHIFRVNSHSGCQGTLCSEQARNLKFQWLQLDSNPQAISSQTNTQSFSQTVRMIELCCECLSSRCIWLCVLFLSCTCFQSESTLYICLNVKELLAESGCKIWSLSDCNWIWTHNHLLSKRTLKHLTNLAIWLSCVDIYIYIYIYICIYTLQTLEKWKL